MNEVLYTDLKPEEVLERIRKYLAEDRGFTIVELIAHLHAEKGSCELRVSGEGIKGNGDYQSKEVLFSQITQLEGEFGFQIVYYGMHVHSSPNGDGGHVMVSIKPGDPVSISIDSHELEFPLKDLTAVIPTVAAPVSPN